MSRRIPPATVARLPVYLRVLDRMGESGVVQGDAISSEVLAQGAGVTASNVRRDLSYLGSFGTRGSGYDVAMLRARVGAALGTDGTWPVAIVGMGNLGRALARYPGLSQHGVVLRALFDVDPSIVGTGIGGIAVGHVSDLPDFVRGKGRYRDPTPLSIGIITTPATAAQSVVDAFVRAGVSSVLNFAPVRLEVPAGVLVRDVDVGTHLLVLSFHERQRLGAPGVPGPDAGDGLDRQERR